MINMPKSSIIPSGKVPKSQSVSYISDKKEEAGVDLKIDGITEAEERDEDDMESKKGGVQGKQNFFIEEGSSDGSSSSDGDDELAGKDEEKEEVDPMELVDEELSSLLLACDEFPKPTPD